LAHILAAAVLGTAATMSFATQAGDQVTDFCTFDGGD
jgi:hypothetical protein